MIVQILGCTLLHLIKAYNHRGLPRVCKCVCGALFACLQVCILHMRLCVHPIFLVCIVFVIQTHVFMYFMYTHIIYIYYIICIDIIYLYNIICYILYIYIYIYIGTFVHCMCLFVHVSLLHNQCIFAVYLYIQTYMLRFTHHDITIHATIHLHTTTLFSSQSLF